MSNRRVSKVGRAPVQTKEVLAAGGTQARSDFAYCKTRRATVDVHECEECPRCARASKSDGVVCWTDTLELDRPPAPYAAGRVDLREAATLASPVEVMGRGQVTVTADASFDQLRALFLERGVMPRPWWTTRAS